MGYSYELPPARWGYSSKGSKTIAAIFAGACLLLLFTLVIASSAGPRPQSNRAKCSSNMYQIGLALTMYSNDDPAGRFAPDLQTLITTECLSYDVFVCPSTDDTPARGNSPADTLSHLYDGGHESYVYIGACLTKDSPADAVALYEPPANHKNDGGNVLFADGHVEYFKRPAIEQIIAMDRRGDRPVYWPPRPATQPGTHP